jgi:hypothetical protein
MLRLCLGAVMAIGILLGAVPAQADIRSAVTKAGAKVWSVWLTPRHTLPLTI